MSDFDNGYNPTAEQQQNMDNLSFDRKYLVNAVEILSESEDGSSIVRNKPLATESKQNELIANYAQKITESGGYTYIAVAQPGTLQSAASWQVKRIDETVEGTTIITWADGDSLYNNVATNLTTLTYS
jgi:hypothetical protein